MLLISEIIEKIKNGSSPVFRPHIPEKCCTPDLQDLIVQSWAEDPAQRPNFEKIKVKLGSIFKYVRLQ